MRAILEGCSRDEAMRRLPSLLRWCWAHGAGEERRFHERPRPLAEEGCGALLGLLANAKSNADTKGLDVENLTVTHIQCNKAIPQRRRTYRAHGRINPYMSNPCHVELALSEKVEAVKREAEPVKRTRKQIARLRSGSKSN